MTSKETADNIEIIKRMDLKIAAPMRFNRPITVEPSQATTEISAKIIHVPSIIAALEREIIEANKRTDDARRATAMLLDIKRDVAAGKL